MEFGIVQKLHYDVLKRIHRNETAHKQIHKNTQILFAEPSRIQIENQLGLTWKLLQP